MLYNIIWFIVLKTSSNQLSIPQHSYYLMHVVPFSILYNTALSRLSWFTRDHVSHIGFIHCIYIWHWYHILWIDAACIQRRWLEWCSRRRTTTDSLVRLIVAHVTLLSMLRNFWTNIYQRRRQYKSTSFWYACGTLIWPFQSPL